VLLKQMEYSLVESKADFSNKTAFLYLSNSDMMIKINSLQYSSSSWVMFQHCCYNKIKKC